MRELYLIRIARPDTKKPKKQSEKERECPWESGLQNFATFGSAFYVLFVVNALQVKFGQEANEQNLILSREIRVFVLTDHVHQRQTDPPSQDFIWELIALAILRLPATPIVSGGLEHLLTDTVSFHFSTCVFNRESKNVFSPVQ